MTKLRLSDYGSLEYNYYISFDENKSVEYAEYTSKNTSIEFNIDDNNLLEISGILENNPVNLKTINHNSNLYDIINESLGDSIFTMNYNSAKQKSDHSFYVTIEILNTKLSFSFEFGKYDKIVMYNNKCIVYNTLSNEINHNHPYKIIYFTKKFIITKYLNDELITYESIENKDLETIDFKLFLYKKDYNSCIFNSMPTSITYNNDKEFCLSYDEIGMIKECTNSDRRKISRYESTQYERITIYPLLYDPFNYDYIGIPYQYFAADKIELDNNSIVSFERRVYKIYNNDIINIINKINSSNYAYKSIIGEFEE